MALPLSNNAEGGTDTVQVTTANSGGASGDAFDLVDAAGAGATTLYDSDAAHGLHGIKVTAPTVAGGPVRFGYTTLFGTQTEIWGRCYMKQTVAPGTVNTIFIADLVGTGTCATISNYAGRLRVDDIVGGTFSTTDITLNAWVRIEFHILFSATVGIVEAKLFNSPESLVADETVNRPAGANTRASGTAGYWGYDGQAGSNQVFSIDDMVVNATGYPGPVSTAVAPTLRVLTGARW